MGTKIKLGLTCISEQLKLKDKAKYSFRTMTRKRFNDLCVKDGRDEALQQLSERILHNVITTENILFHCSNSDIGHYRLSSNLFPLITDPTLEISVSDLPNSDRIISQLKHLKPSRHNISISIHPDQFNVLASKNEEAVTKTIEELNFQAWIMDTMGLPQDHTAPMNIHINYTPKMDESLEIVADRFFNNLFMCDSGVFKRLTIENEDKGFFNVDNCLKFSEYLFDQYEYNLPVCYDNLHDFCNPSQTINVAFQAERCAYTWVNTNKPHSDHCEHISDFHAPVFHWSEGRPDKPRAHADYFALGHFPPYIAVDPDRPAIWECEVKLKDIAIQKLVEVMELNSPKNILDYEEQLV